MNEGYVYCLSTKTHNLLKIGRTKRNPLKRAIELSNTGVPDKFKVEISKKVKDCVETEKLIHNELKKFRWNKKKEFFNVSLNYVKNIFDNINSEEEINNDNLSKQINFFFVNRKKKLEILDVKYEFKNKKFDVKKELIYKKILKKNIEELLNKFCINMEIKGKNNNIKITNEKQNFAKDKKIINLYINSIINIDNEYYAYNKNIWKKTDLDDIVEIICDNISTTYRYANIYDGNIIKMNKFMDLQAYIYNLYKNSYMKILKSYLKKNIYKISYCKLNNIYLKHKDFQEDKNDYNKQIEINEENNTETREKKNFDNNIILPQEINEMKLTLKNMINMIEKQNKKINKLENIMEKQSTIIEKQNKKINKIKYFITNLI